MIDQEDSDLAVYPYPPIDPIMLGRRIRMARKLAGYESADTFAAVLREKMGVTQGGNPIQGHSIRAIERGDVDASMQLISATIALTGISIDFFNSALRPDVAKAWGEAKGIQ